MKPVLILRPEPGASATAARAESLGLEPIVAPLFEVEPVAWEAPPTTLFDALLLTSANAVRHGGSQLAQYRSLPVHAVGESTGKAAREAGFAVQTVGSGDVHDLLRQLPGSLRLLHLAGEQRRDPAHAEVIINAIPVYRTIAVQSPCLPVRVPVVALVHSPRAGERLTEVACDRSMVTIVAISDAAAAACGMGWQSVHVADRPSDDALLSLAARLCKGGSQS